MSLNIAHGRNSSMNQIFLSKAKIKRNLLLISKLIKQHRPDVIALQEADGPSLWSGSFNHVAFIATNAKYRYVAHGLHVSGLKIHYGTALVSNSPLQNPFSFVFSPSLPTFSKGFIIATIAWPSHPEQLVDLVSIHLDYSRASVQKEQVAELVNYLRQRKRPVIIMGDFNLDWSRKKGSVYKQLQKIGYRAINTDKHNQVTFPGMQTRLDWILVSDELIIKNEKILTDKVSDHYSIVATITRK